MPAGIYLHRGEPRHESRAAGARRSRSDPTWHDEDRRAARGGCERTVRPGLREGRLLPLRPRLHARGGAHLGPRRAPHDTRRPGLRAPRDHGSAGPGDAHRRLRPAAWRARGPAAVAGADLERGHEIAAAAGESLVSRTPGGRELSALGDAPRYAALRVSPHRRLMRTGRSGAMNLTPSPARMTCHPPSCTSRWWW